MATRQASKHAASAFSAMRRGSKGRKISALAQLRGAQLDSSSAGLPNPVAIAVSVIDAFGVR